MFVLCAFPCTYITWKSRWVALRNISTRTLVSLLNCITSFSENRSINGAWSPDIMVSSTSTGSIQRSTTLNVADTPWKGADGLQVRPIQSLLLVESAYWHRGLLPKTSSRGHWAEHRPAAWLIISSIISYYIVDWNAGGRLGTSRHKHTCSLIHALS